jgi:hypothetical protein
METSFKHTMKVMFNQFRVARSWWAVRLWGRRRIWFSQQIPNCPRNVLQPRNSEWICHHFAENFAYIANISDYLAISSRNNSLCNKSQSFSTHITILVACHWTVWNHFWRPLIRVTPLLFHRTLIMLCWSRWVSAPLNHPVRLAS